MFQTFDDPPGGAHVAARIEALRAWLAREGLAGFLVPRADEFQNEYVPPSAERLAWLTGFTGSAGLAAVLTGAAALFVDGRYTVQARAQADTDVFEIAQVPDVKPSQWIADHLDAGETLGYDPRLHTVKEIERVEAALHKAGAMLQTVRDNPLDAVWTDRPGPPLAPVLPHPLEYAGRDAADKIAHVQQALKDARAQAAVITAPDSTCWLFNIRGGDVPHTPLALAFTILHADAAPELFIDPRKLTEATRAHLAPVAMLQPPDALETRLAVLGQSGATVRLDFDTCPRWFADRLRAAGAEPVDGSDPCQLPKAIKTHAEIAGARSAHERDAVAMCRFLAWIDANASAGGVDEIAAARQLEAFRAGTGALKEISFDTISGAGPNGAIVHYRVTQATNRRLEAGTLYLVDSGAQYADGTTDITRTVAVGEPSGEMRHHFTRVLKGHIGLATARFPEGTRGQDLDPFARAPLWAAGLDFDHGTGHGVGSYLSVHEGPQRISRLGTVALQPGMIVSNEPGYYREGHYGIRIENLVLVTEPEMIAGGERAMLGFDTLTLAPIDRRLIDLALLTTGEIAWLDAYHARVFETVSGHLDAETHHWLMQACLPLKEAAGG